MSAGATICSASAHDHVHQRNRFCQNMSASAHTVSSLIYVYVCLVLNIYTLMGRETHSTGLTSFAVHQVRDGWEIVAPSDDPTTPAYWRVGVIRQHGCRGSSDRIDATVMSVCMEYLWRVS